MLTSAVTKNNSEKDRLRNDNLSTEKDENKGISEYSSDLIQNHSETAPVVIPGIQMKRQENTPSFLQSFQQSENQQNSTPLQMKSGSSTSMPEVVQQKMESSFQTDFSSVNIHNNSPIAAEIGAKAYTQGNDIHFANGEYNPESTSGQELLGHELTHVVQQRQGRVVPTTQAKGLNVNDNQSLENEADVLGSKAAHGQSIQMKQASAVLTSGVLQMAKGYISSKAQTRLHNGILDPTKKKGLIKKTQMPLAEQIEESPKGDVYNAMQEIQLEDDLTKHIKDPTTGENVWLKVMGANAFIRAAKVVSHEISMQGFAGSVSALDENLQPTPENQENLLKKVASGSENVTKVTDIAGGVLDTVNDDSTKINDKEVGTGGTKIAGGVIGAGAGILGFVQSISKLVNAENSWDRLDGIIGAVGSASDTTSKILSAVNGATGSDGVKDVANGFASVTGILGALKSGIATIKGIVDLVQLIEEKGKAGTAAEYVTVAASIIENGLSTAKSVVESTKTIMELSGAATAWAGPILAAIDIPLKALSIIKEGFYFVQSAYYRYKISKERTKMMEKKKTDTGLSEEQIEEKLLQYNQSEGKVFDLNRKKSKWLAELNNINTTGKGGGLFGGRKEDLEIALSGASGNAAYVGGIIANGVKTTAIDAKIATATQEQTAASKYDDNGTEKNIELGDLSMATEIQSSNSKRMVRAGVQIVADCVSIAGSITQLVTLLAGGNDMGAGLLIGSGLKAAGAGVKMGMPLIRWIKQQGRNKAASDEAKGKETMMTSMFDSDKSDSKKANHRKKVGLMIMKQAQNLVGKDYVADRPMFDTFETFISSTGASPRELYKLNGQPDKQLSLLIKELSKREL